MDMKNVEQYRLDEGRIEIKFTLHEQIFYLLVRKSGDYFIPATVIHGFGSQGICFHCSGSGRVLLCTVLDRQVNSLFEQLINYPSIRLEWLYIPHAESENFKGVEVDE